MWQGQKMAFKTRASVVTRPDTLEGLYNELPRTQLAVKGLWVHQGDVLRSYEDGHTGLSDVALELPTGTGKTLPGLLIAEWARRERSGSVIYACPTSQLAGQVVRIAEREGVPAVQLIGSSQDWPSGDQAAYFGGEAIAITNYSSVFNSSPKLGKPRLLVLDDAHAGEQFVGEQYALDISRRDHPEVYESVLNALSPLVDGMFVHRLRNENADPIAFRQIRLVTPGINPDVIAELDFVLAKLPVPLNFKFSMIRGGIKSAVVFLSYRQIQIRPMTPPTFDNPVFDGAKQRLYLSATLGSGGELERSFGRANIKRLVSPFKVPPRSGRRFFIFPELAKGDDPLDLINQLIGLTNKAILLTPGTTDEAKRKARELAPKAVPVFGVEDVHQNLDVFAKSEAGILGLANRYDGLDLPDEDCRMVILDGLPDSYSLQERFLSERANAHAVLSERVRTRVIQGAGRCTRGPNDFAVVIVMGSELTNYLARPEVRASLDSELQAEVEFGWQNSLGATVGEIIDNAQVFLKHDQQWRESGEPALTEYRREAQMVLPLGSEALQSSVALEVEAWGLAFQGDWLAASEKMQQAAREIGKGGESTRGSRSLLLYFAALWLHLGATDEAQFAKARVLMRDVSEAIARCTWFREMAPLPKQDAIEISAEDEIAISQIASRLNSGVKVERHEKLIREMISDLEQTEANPYGRGLTNLGKLLGADSFVPDKAGRCDSAWIWGNALWIAVEAKTEQHEFKTLPLSDIRQTNTHLDLLKTDRGVEVTPPESFSVIVSPRGVVAPADATAANPNLYLVSPRIILDLAQDLELVWRNLIAGGSRQQEVNMSKFVTDELQGSGCLPSQIKERLTISSIRPMS
jgi:hypothetical protein